MVRTKRWNDPAEPDDGFRLLVCRIRPRGVSKRDETWDDWWPDLGPSRALLDDFHGKGGSPISWGSWAARSSYGGSAISRGARRRASRSPCSARPPAAIPTTATGPCWPASSQESPLPDARPVVTLGREAGARWRANRQNRGMDKAGPLTVRPPG